MSLTWGASCLAPVRDLHQTVKVLCGDRADWVHTPRMKSISSPASNPITGHYANSAARWLTKSYEHSKILPLQEGAFNFGEVAQW